MLINLVMIPVIPVRNRSECPKCWRGNGLERGGKGRRQAEDPPFPPRPRADYCHIHPWIFSLP
jgi:hypothetical protein